MIVAICDDNGADRKKIMQLCEAAFDAEKDRLKFFEFQTGREFLESEEYIDVLILDVKMPDMTGIELKDHLKYMLTGPLIVFVTEYESAMREAFGPNVYAFLLKHEMERKLPFLFQELQSRLEHYIKLGEIDSREVAYVESRENYLKYFLFDGRSILTLGTIKEAASALAPYDFIQISRGCIVNYKAIWSVNGRTIRTKSGDLEIAARRRKEVKEQIQKLNRKRGRYC